ncbi:hypothetical protein CHS0354_016339 [Potamilus streckersoni]|uniref:Protein kinase domain-containing protein n=1 Tax=Potamilus streckersoni TaxID=2493646 RepID=A0AAE0VYI3_9BIVA|nr:hypothetical protein CHS0354_016339 [Potamilus streckersoni]
MSEPQQSSSYTNVISSKLKGHEDLEFPFCDDSNKYEKLAKIGQGTFGEVFKARDKKTRLIVAMKKVLMENEKEGKGLVINAAIDFASYQMYNLLCPQSDMTVDMHGIYQRNAFVYFQLPISALREIKILQSLKHENVVNLIGTCRTKGNYITCTTYNSKFYLILEYCEHDLAGLLDNANVKFSLGEIKNVLQQLLNGISFIHSNEIMDLKPENILITKYGVLKIADFGLAREFSLPTQKDQPKEYTNRVVTLWYRPPELLLGEKNYTTAIDMWGAGCIMAEMWTRRPIIQGDSEQHQLYLIILLCGSINPEVWPGVDQIELYRSLKKFAYLVPIFF